ncbi:MAG: 30S ribosomal protein S18 [Candidatus Muiribacterium halophilum]|uniref:Small ribosomal subunit protein bS18 n=1 Tax=Muiribacterium halophilum TaxID=2053465 RepID=A0A2N5ZEU9_MUIH1|nr:MAG: 30S ribosomal protein S18 [Candidatus Muirbacterium halophilum]
MAYRGFRRKRKKVCLFCKNPNIEIEYKNVNVLKKFVSDRGKILPRRATGACAKHQRKIATAVKQARNIALLPFCNE